MGEQRARLLEAHGERVAGVIVVPIILAPGGDATRSRQIATVEIENDTTSNSEKIGHYKVRMRGGIHRDATVKNWPRHRSHVDLVAEALAALVRDERKPPPRAKEEA